MRVQKKLKKQSNGPWAMFIAACGVNLWTTLGGRFDKMNKYKSVFKKHL